MRHINGAYTNYFNSKRDRAGHLFQGRYKAILVEKDEYAKELSRYIHLNPVRAGMADLPEEYEWSSYRAYIGKNEKPEWLCTDFIHGYFGKRKATVEKNYHKFVNSLINAEYDSPLDKVKGSVLLGTKDFINEIKEKFITGKNGARDIPSIKALSDRVSVDAIYEAVEIVSGDDPVLARNIKIYLAKRFTGKRLKEIGREFGIGESGVSQACRRMTKRIDSDKKLERKLQKVIKKLNFSGVKA